MRATASALSELASLYGIQACYAGADGSTQIADTEVVVALLRSLAAPVEHPDDSPEALRARQLADARRVLEPVAVQRSGRASQLTVTLPEGVDPREVRLSLYLEEADAGYEWLAPRLVLFSAKEVEGRRFGLYRLDLNEASRDPIPPGYHRLVLESSELNASALLIAAPACPESGRAWGAFIPLHALRSETDWGTGSYSDLASLGRFVSALGASMLGGLPLYPCFLDPPADPSPYRPVSRLAYNELFIDPTVLPELATSPEARHLLEDRGFLDRIAAVHGSLLVEYEEVSRLRRQVLEKLAQSLFTGAATRRRAELDNFTASHPELVDYARFRAGLARPRRRGADAAQTGGSDAGEDPAFGYHLYCQWAAATQLSAADATVRLYADLPIGVHPEGFDPYSSPDSFVPGARGGAPPDAFFSSGQDWGFPPLHPERIREDGYGYLRAVFSRAFRHAGYMRIDHVMGLQRLYAIPEGFDAKHGAYVSYRAEELHALVALEAHRAGTVVVGEDLGTVPDEVRRRMASDKMLRSWVFQFESSSTEPLPCPQPDVLASLGTHDLPRFGTFLWGEDIAENQRSGELAPKQAAAQRAARESWRLALLDAVGAGAPELSPAEKTAAALEGALLHLGASAAELLLVELEELWGERRPQNRPGTGPEADNWRRRASLSMGEIRADRELSGLLSRLDHLRRVGPVPQRGGVK
jgi:4-alpha-glucanotransferase